MRETRSREDRLRRKRRNRIGGKVRLRRNRIGGERSRESFSPVLLGS